MLNDKDEARYAKIPGWVRNANLTFATINYKGNTYIIYKTENEKKRWLIGDNE